MQETVPSAALLGMEVYRVRVEVAITRGAPLIQVVGLPASAVREGKERIRAAAAQSGLHLPGLRITVNLAPAGVRKDGAAFDLPILVGILAAADQAPAARARRWAMVGELGLDGTLRPVRGCLPVALHARAEGDVEGLIVPRDNLRETLPAVGARPGGSGGLRDEVRLADHRPFRVLGARHLEGVLAFLEGEADLPGPDDLPPADDPGPGEGEEPPDLADVRGQALAKRALEVAAAGGHNLLLRGEPGAGKTMLARRLPGLLPEMSLEESVEVTAVHSVAGRLPPDAGLVAERPFRSPHHTTSRAGLVGGGAVPRPGEVSMAHGGVLFLDELPEFARSTLEALRQPMEEGAVRIVRARASVCYPARFLLAAAMNPCPCGYHGSLEHPHRCTCQPAAVREYGRRVSGPLLDRVDLQVEVPAVRWEELREDPDGERSAAVRQRVVEARQRSARRLGRAPAPPGRGADRGRPRCNAEMRTAEVDRHCALDATGEALLKRAVEKFGLSARGYHRVLRVARTVADLDGSDGITGAHLAGALGYRMPAGEEEAPTGRAGAR